VTWQCHSWAYIQKNVNQDTIGTLAHPCFFTALFTRAKPWNQSRWIKKMWHIYMMEYYSAIKKNEIMVFAGKWIEIEIMLSEISQVQKDKGLMFSFVCRI
jgi:hypothetical protein